MAATDVIRSTVPKGFLSASEAAEALGVSDRTVARWCEAGRVKGARRQEWAGRQGYRWLVPARALEALKANGGPS